MDPYGFGERLGNVLDLLRLGHFSLFIIVQLLSKQRLPGHHGLS